MRNDTVFETLIDIAIQESDEAAKRLGLSVQANQQAKEKLSLLMNYREDYVQQLGAKLVSGMNARSHQNFCDFLDGLDLAIHRQQEVCQGCEQATAKAMEAWRDRERQRLSFKTLGQRQTLIAERKESQREQKLSDEFAARPRRSLH